MNFFRVAIVPLVLAASSCQPALAQEGTILDRLAKIEAQQAATAKASATAQANLEAKIDQLTALVRQLQDQKVQSPAQACLTPPGSPFVSQPVACSSSLGTCGSQVTLSGGSCGAMQTEFYTTRRQTRRSARCQ